MGIKSDDRALTSGRISRPLLNRLVKFAMAATSVISTICSLVKCSSSAARHSSASAVCVSSRAYWMAARSGSGKTVVLLGLQGAQISSSVMPAFLPLAVCAAVQYAHSLA